MKPKDLRAKTVDELVNHFAEIALEQDEALLRDEHARFNCLYEQMAVVEKELKARTGDQRRALAQLYGHANAQVRLKAVIATLFVLPERARIALQEIADSGQHPQAGDAGMTILALADGIFQPT